MAEMMILIRGGDNVTSTLDKFVDKLVGLQILSISLKPGFVTLPLQMKLRVCNCGNPFVMHLVLENLSPNGLLSLHMNLSQ